ncbi:MAG: hypothetical protein K0R51_1059 [Cytophagaceae bacterium]|jgi:hypothetical protein|nr:hypothetical protein [Cytophagaceae bacterium]
MIIHFNKPVSNSLAYFFCVLIPHNVELLSIKKIVLRILFLFFRYWSPVV